MQIVESFKKYLIDYVPRMVTKSDNLAHTFYNLDDERKADMYVAASLEKDSIYTYSNYSDVLSSAVLGFTLDEISKYKDDITSLPKSKQQILVRLKRASIISSYIEKNNYYRMINGQPDIEDTDFVYLRDDQYEAYGIGEYRGEVFIPNRLPIHKIDESICKVMESDGAIALLKKQYPDKKYLDYVGERRIDIVKARTAGNYELLYFPKDSINDIFYNKFIYTYDECKEYFMTVIYNRHLSDRYSMYDRYIGFSILTMTIQRMAVSLFENMIFRDFFDLDTLRIFLSSYNIPYSELGITRLRTIAKNLNKLLLKKGTSQVIFDILSLIDIGNYSIYRYILVKQHKLDDNGKPIFVYKTEKNSNGEDVQVLDKSKMYDLYFNEIDISSDDPDISANSGTFSSTYESFIADDPTWVNDSNLMTKLLNDDMNWVNTKYMNVKLLYKFQDMMFESAYLFRLLLDKKNETSGVAISFDSISKDPISLFDICILLMCLICRLVNMKPTLLSTPSTLLAIKGFNFKSGFTKLRDELLKVNDKLPSDLQEFIRLSIPSTISSPSDVNNIYSNIRELSELLTTAMNETTDKDMYYLYKQLYDTILVTDINNSLFKLPDGSIPKYYSDYLKEYNTDVFEYYDSQTSETVSDSISYIVDKLSSVLLDVKYLRNLSSVDQQTIENVIKLVKYFKSYTIDIKNMSVVYMMDSKYYNVIRLIDYLRMSVTESISESDWKIMYDTLSSYIDIDISEYTNIYEYVQNSKCTVITSDKSECRESLIRIQ